MLIAVAVKSHSVFGFQISLPVELENIVMLPLPGTRCLTQVLLPVLVTPDVGRLCASANHMCLA